MTDHTLYRYAWLVMRDQGFDHSHSTAAIEGLLRGLIATNQIGYAQVGRILNFRDKILRHHQQKLKEVG